MLHHGVELDLKCVEIQSEMLDLNEKIYLQVSQLIVRIGDLGTISQKYPRFYLKLTKMNKERSYKLPHKRFKSDQ